MPLAYLQLLETDATSLPACSACWFTALSHMPLTQRRRLSSLALTGSHALSITYQAVYLSCHQQQIMIAITTNTCVVTKQPSGPWAYLVMCLSSHQQQVMVAVTSCLLAGCDEGGVLGLSSIVEDAGLVARELGHLERDHIPTCPWQYNSTAGSSTGLSSRRWNLACSQRVWAP